MLPIMAMKITAKNYPIAVACLWPGKKVTPLKEVLGYYLVINKLETSIFFKKELFNEYSNSWMSKEDFDMFYMFVDQELEDQFITVKPISI